MESFKSKFSIKEVIIIPITISIIVIGMMSIITFVSIDMTNDIVPLYKTPIWTVLLFGLLLFYSLYYYLKTFKTYKFDDKGILVSNVFGKEFYSWKTVKDISLVGKEIESFLWQIMIVDGSAILLNSGSELNLFTKYYSNMPEIRRLLETVKNQIKANNQICLDSFLKASYDKEIKKEKSEVNSEVNIMVKKFKGNHFFTFNGMCIYFFFLLGIFMFIHSYSSMTLIGVLFLVGMPIIIFIGLGFQFYFFELDSKYLYIKNHLPFFKSKRYDYEDIQSVFIEMDYKKSHKIRIVTNNFETSSFMANSLRDKHWRNFIIELKKKEITVKDELFFE